MIFEKWLMPDRVFKDIYEIDKELLLKDGVRGIISDIDNTLVTYDDPLPTKPVLEWFDMLKGNGIKISFVSNNEHERVETFNSELKYFASAKSGKPFSKELRRAMEYMGTDESNTVMLGDQLLTDALAGKICGLRVYIVPPIKDKTNLFFRAKRKLEVPYMKKYFKINGNK